MPGAGLEPAQD